MAGDRGIHALRAEQHGVARPHDVGDGKAADEAELLRLVTCPAAIPARYVPFVVLGLEGAQVVEVLEAGTVLEGHVGEAGRHLQHRRAVREAGPEDEPVAGAGKLGEHPFGGLRVVDVVERGHVDPVAERGGDGLGAEAVLPGPADLRDRRDVDDADLEGLGGPREPGEREPGRRQAPRPRPTASGCPPACVLLRHGPSSCRVVFPMPCDAGSGWFSTVRAHEARSKRGRCTGRRTPTRIPAASCCVVPDYAPLHFSCPTGPSRLAGTIRRRGDETAGGSDQVDRTPIDGSGSK